MDHLLKKEGMDLKFTLYKVLATSNEDGFMEFIKGSKTVQSIEIENQNDVSAYLNSLSSDSE
jgi:phosphatidylinositol kinase/protein kinase (PI-3  family)